MIGLYLNGRALWSSMTTDPKNGSITRGTAQEVNCQVVDDSRVESVNDGRDTSEGINSGLIIEKTHAIKQGDMIQVINVRGQDVTRPERIVKGVAVVGGFSSSHLEVLI